MHTRVCLKFGIPVLQSEGFTLAWMLIIYVDIYLGKKIETKWTVAIYLDHKMDILHVIITRCVPHRTGEKHVDTHWLSKINGVNPSSS